MTIAQTTARLSRKRRGTIGKVANFISQKMSNGRTKKPPMHIIAGLSTLISGCK